MAMTWDQVRDTFEDGDYITIFYHLGNDGPLERSSGYGLLLDHDEKYGGRYDQIEVHKDRQFTIIIAYAYLGELVEIV